MTKRAAAGTKCCPAKFRHYHPFEGSRPAPSVTEVLGVIDKPALKGWAFKESRAATLAAAQRVYAETHTAGCSAVGPSDFAAMVNDAAPKSLWNLPKTAADIGTLVHARIESEVRQLMGEQVELVEVPEYTVVRGQRVTTEAWNAIQSWHAWLRNNDVKFLAIEARAYSPSLWCAGTLDALAVVNQRATVVDFKTSKAVYDEYLLQVGAYRQFLLERPVLSDGYRVAGPIGGLILRLPKQPGDGFEAFDVPWEWHDELLDGFVYTLGTWETKTYVLPRLMDSAQ